MSKPARWDLLFKRDDLAVREIRETTPDPLRPGEVRLALEKFALTANVVTYARLHVPDLPFWDVFSEPEGYGRVPVWGYARVEESRRPGVEVGRRYFGYLPLATHHTVPAVVSPRGFADTAPQRDFLFGWYRTYQAVGEPDGLDDLRAVMRPLFPAAFNLADFIGAQAAAGARRALVTSASSKTAVALADLLSGHPELSVVGVTSPRNVAFVEGLGRYSTVVSYDALASVPVPPRTVLVDFTGASERLAAVYERFGQSLCHTALVGYTDPRAVIDPVPGLPGPEPEIFFTPHIEEMAIAREGEDRYHTRYGEAERRFLRTAEEWFTVHHGHGHEEILDTFDALLSGNQPPQLCSVLTP